MQDKAIIFDLDGTLIDSLKDIALCANEVLKEFDFKTHEIEDYKNFVGSGAEVLIRNCAPKSCDENTISKLLKRFKEIYDEDIHKNTKPYEDINNLLQTLKQKQYKVGVLSNKPHKFTLKYVEDFFTSYNLEEVHGQKEEIPKKPHKMGAVNIAKAFNIPCEKVYFIGDSDVDMQTAKNAGMIAVGVSWGFRGVEELLENGADYILKEPLELLELLEE